MLKMKLGVIGCGNMGEAIIQGIILKKLLKPGDISVFDCMREKSDRVKKRFSLSIKDSNAGVAKSSDAVILAVKPQDSAVVLEEIKQLVHKKLIVSIMAGVKMGTIRERFGRECHIVRAMPNMPAFVGESMTAICFNGNVSEKEKSGVNAIFRCLGSVYETDESMMNAITALTGSGPAYFFYIAECMIEAAVRFGFSYEDALKLVIQTMKGSALALEGLFLKPDILRAKVTSKRGTTEAALKVFEKEKLKNIFSSALRAAKKRAEELSR